MSDFDKSTPLPYPNASRVLSRRQVVTAGAAAILLALGLALHARATVLTLNPPARPVLAWPLPHSATSAWPLPDGSTR